MRGLLRGAADVLVLLHGILAGTAVSLMVAVFQVGAFESALAGGLVAVALTLLRHFARLPDRARSERSVASVVRGILDRHLALTRIDPVGIGDFTTLRHLGEVARAGRLREMITFGGPALTLSRELQKLVGELEREVGRSYLRLDARGRATVDAFATDLRAAMEASAAAMHLSPISDPADRSAQDAELFKRLAETLASVVASGDDLDRTFDTGGSARATAARAKSLDERQRREGHAAAVLLKNAREGGYAVGVMHVQQPIDVGDDVPAFVEHLRRARDILLNVDPEAFREATDEVRTAHRQLTYEDLSAALEAATRMANSDEAERTFRERTARFHTDLAALEAIAGRRGTS